MNQRVHPAMVAAALVLLVVVLVFYWRRSMAEPPSAIGFITDPKTGITREMTRQEGINMGLAMQGKARMPAGVGDASKPGGPHDAPPGR